jgi:large subunit ribosomal protein L18
MPVALRKMQRLERRVKRVRKRVFGTPQRPRLCVSRSNANVYAQIIDDTSGRTLCAVSSLSREMKELLAKGGDARAAQAVGRRLGEKARALGLEQVCFDRRGRKYHGRIKALADAAREAGLRF